MKIAALAAVFLLAVACGDQTEDPGGHQHDPGAGHAGVSTAGFGTAAHPVDADRTEKVEVVEPLKFEPTSLRVEVDETITFELSNTGNTDHEFVLGDAAYQDGHGSEMGGMEHSEGNGVFLARGASGSVTWTFTEPGELLFACHVDGHYKAGMFGRIIVR